MSTIRERIGKRVITVDTRSDREKLESLKEFMVLLFGCERGRVDDIEHLKDMARSCMEEWQDLARTGETTSFFSRQGVNPTCFYTGHKLSNGHLRSMQPNKRRLQKTATRRNGIPKIPPRLP